MGTKRGPKPGLVSAYRKSANQPSSVEVSPPSYLPKDAIQHWNFITCSLSKLGILQDVDVIHLAMLCTEVDKYWKCQEHIDAEGLVQSGEKTGEVKSAWVRIQESALDRILSLSRGFGLSPSSRKELTSVISDSMSGEPVEDKVPLRLVK